MFRYRALSASIALGATLATDAFAVGSTAPTVAPVVGQVQKAAAYLRMQGIKGESQDSGFSAAIEILSFTAPRELASAITSPRDPQTGAKRAMPTLVFVKRVDSATPQLRAAQAQGTHFATVVFDAIAPANGEFYEITLSDVTIASLTSSGGSPPQEKLALGSAQIDAKLAKLDAQGGRGPLLPLPSGFDVTRINKTN